MNYDLRMLIDDLKIKKCETKGRHFLLLIAYCLLLITPTFAQEKHQKAANKTTIPTTIKGVKYYLHTVEKGQTLFAIAKLYDKDLNDIVIENPETIDGIKPGQVLKIPVEKAIKKITITVPDTSNCILHKVEQGQTLYSLSKQYNVSIDKIKMLNPELAEGLKIGQTLKIPSLKLKEEKTLTTTKKGTSVIKESVESKKNSTIVVNPTKTEKVLDSTATVCPPLFIKELKDEYNIAFFLPFHADEANALELENLVKGNISLPNKTMVALPFYQGALLAIDSLKKQKLNAKIFIYDIDDSDSLNINKLLKKPELASMNLMVGPLYASSFMPLAKFAKEHHIAIVSPFTQVNKILFENPYVFKLSPTNILQVSQLAHFVVDTFRTQNIILVNTTELKDAPYFNAFRNTANSELLKIEGNKADSVKIAYHLEAVKTMLSSTKINVVVLPSNNQSYVSEFISKLNVLRDKYNIMLFGLSSWNNYDNMDFDYLNNLSLHLPSNNYVDYDNTVTKKFIATYREKYNAEPNMYAYEGYDATFYFVSSLQQYGVNFLNNLSQMPYQGIETNFSFSQYPRNSGFENKYVFILKYKDYKLVKAN